MHDNSQRLMQEMFHKFAPEGGGRLCYDIGSYDVNGTYKETVLQRGWKYVGVDIVEGPNVDLIIEDSTTIALMGGSAEWTKAELIISGQCLEHVESPILWMSKIGNLMLPGALLFLVAPSNWPEHKHPRDYWRILPDGMRVLALWGKFEVLECGLSYAQKVPYKDGVEYDGEDCWAVMRKPS